MLQKVTNVSGVEWTTSISLLKSLMMSRKE
jgi:hypothetical protein